ncbi:response regulator transcription factor [Jatrophihabitans sp.]|uniref:response regulator transcription factor n=1 Tax=Jatrophihabitans sp. TaxID=1932789 RepID=UPI0030C6BC07|nr:hypothetical protein [Jatrophihabitans sp.]
MLKLIACDRHLIFSDALAAMLGRRGHQMVARACSPEDGLQLPERSSVDAWLTEIDFPSSPNPVTRLRAALPGMPIVVFTGSEDRDDLRAAVRSGADGVVLKSEGVDEVEHILRRVTSPAWSRTPGQAVWSSGARTAAARSLATRTTEISGLGSLTAREVEVLRRLTSGDSTETIASGMGVGISTVRTHLQHLYSKLDVHSRLELVSAGARLTGTTRPVGRIGHDATSARHAS